MSKNVSRKGAKRVQVRLSDEMAGRIEGLAERLAIPESALCSMLIAGGLARFGEMVGKFGPEGVMGELQMKQMDDEDQAAAERRAERVEAEKRIGYVRGV